MAGHRLAVLLALSSLWACSFGPGVRCHSDADCQGWGACGARGYCLLQPARAELSATALALDTCSAQQAVGLSNTGGADLTFEASIDALAFSVSPAEGTVAFSETVELTVSASASGSEADGQLAVETNDEEHPLLVVPVTLRPASAPCTPPPAQTPPSSATDPVQQLPGSTLGPPSATLTPSSLSFGLVACGARAPAQTLSLTNTGTGSVTLTATLEREAATRFAVNAPPTLAAGARATITVTPNAIPTTASTAADGYGGTLHLTATSGGQSLGWAVALHQTAQGAVLGFSPTSLSFSADKGKKQSKDFTLTNTGNLAASFVLTVAGPDVLAFSATPVAGQAAVGAPVHAQATFTAPLVDPKQRSATLSLTSTTPLCAPAPALSLSGTVR